MADDDKYRRGETVTLKLECTVGVTATTPDTSYKVTVTDKTGTAVVDDEAMTVDAVGTLTYKYTVASDAVLGKYSVEYTTVHREDTNKPKDTFTVEE